MPPAFNLSQDQTLQFNPFKSLNRRWPYPNPFGFYPSKTKTRLRTRPFEQARLLRRVSTNYLRIPSKQNP
jgi:hypothetical protein